MEIEVGSKWIWKSGKIDDQPERLKNIVVTGFNDLNHVLYKYADGKECHKNRKLFVFDFDKVIGE